MSSFFIQKVEESISWNDWNLLDNPFENNNFMKILNKERSARNDNVA